MSSSTWQNTKNMNFKSNYRVRCYRIAIPQHSYKNFLGRLYSLTGAKLSSSSHFRFLTFGTKALLSNQFIVGLASGPLCALNGLVLQLLWSVPKTKGLDLGKNAVFNGYASEKGNWNLGRGVLCPGQKGFCLGMAGAPGIALNGLADGNPCGAEWLIVLVALGNALW